MSGPVRAGDVVHRRPLRPNLAATSALRLLQAAGWPGAPRLLATRSDGGQTVTFLPGRVPWQQPVPAWAVTDQAMVGVARLVREFHDLTAGTALAGDAEVLCHHDRESGDGGQPYAFIDWDLAGPGRRIEDVAHVCWMWLDLGPTISDVPAAVRQIRLVLTAYGATFGIGDVVPVISWWQHRCWRGIEKQARDGVAAMRDLVTDGTAATIRSAAAWTDEHAHDLACE